jgi:hypothetical protein
MGKVPIADRSARIGARPRFVSWWNVAIGWLLLDMAETP